MQDIKSVHGRDLSSNERVRRRLRGAAENAKRALSTSDCFDVDLEGLISGDDYSTAVTRAKFEDLCEQEFKRCMAPVQSCMEAARLKPSQIDEVVLVGGSTRIPRIQELLQMEFAGKTLNKSVNPDEAVAQGAALKAAMIENRFQDTCVTLQDVAPLSLGISCHGDVASVVIPRNTNIPVTVTKTNYTNPHDDCTSISFPVYEGERAVASSNHLLGEFTMSGIPSGPKDSHQFAVTFTIDADGILSVTAKHMGTNKTMGIKIDHRSGRYTDEEIQEMIDEAERYRRADEAELKKQKAKNRLEDYVNGICNALRAGLQQDLLQSDVLALTHATEEANDWMANQSADSLPDAIYYYNKRDQLEALCESALRNVKSAFHVICNCTTVCNMRMLRLYPQKLLILMQFCVALPVMKMDGFLKVPA